MNNKENLNIPQPDPGWDYYMIWHSIQHVKAKMDEALKIITGIEIADDAIDRQLHDSLDLVSDELIELIQQLEPDGD